MTVANTFIKPERIAATGLGLLQREIILPSLVWRDAGGSFRGVAGDTISIRVPARTTARTRPLRGARGTASEGEGIITMDNLVETKIDVTLDTDVYSAVPITDEELTLDISDFGSQILAPQVRAVAEGLENAVAAEMMGATYANTVEIDPDDPFPGVIDARAALNLYNVPMNDRIIVLGSNLETAFLKSDRLARHDSAGDSNSSALRDATIGRLGGFGRIVVSQAIDPDIGFAFHRTAYVLSMQAPVVPNGASFGSSQSYQGLAMRWLRDYDFRNVQDRSLVDVYYGTNIVADGPDNEEQTVTVTGGPTGGTFTLTYSGQTTAGITYNASAAAVKSALAALSNLDASDIEVSGSAGSYTVTFNSGANVSAMTASGSGLTGGTSPGVTVATANEGGGDGSFVRAVKLTLGA
jgi:coat protein Gp5